MYEWGKEGVEARVGGEKKRKWGREGKGGKAGEGGGGNGVGGWTT